MDLSARIIHEIQESSLYEGLGVADFISDRENVAMCVGAWLSDIRNVAMLEGDDLALFDYVAPGIYSIHLFFRSRGKEAVEAGKAITRRMFDHGAKMIVGHVPAINRKAGVIARMAGYHFAGTRETPYGKVLVYLIAPETH